MPLSIFDVRRIFLNKKKEKQKTTTVFNELIEIKAKISHQSNSFTVYIIYISDSNSWNIVLIEWQFV